MTTNLNETFAAVQVASRELALLNDNVINQILNAVADAAIAETPFILSENEKDLARMDKNDPKYDRLKLTEERLKGIAADTRNVATLPSPLGIVSLECDTATDDCLFFCSWSLFPKYCHFYILC